MLKTVKRKHEADQSRIFRNDNRLFTLRRACMLNALDLIKEAQLLYKHRRYARAFALAYTAHEEIGKSQIVADYITGIASQEEFQDAFRHHKLKSAYMGRYFAISSNDTQDVTVEYDLNKGKPLFDARNASLYVGVNDQLLAQSPKQLFRAKPAKDAIVAVQNELRHILWAEKFNERIGSEALAR